MGYLYDGKAVLIQNFDFNLAYTFYTKSKDCGNLFGIFAYYFHYNTINKTNDYTEMENGYFLLAEQGFSGAIQ